MGPSWFVIRSDHGGISGVSDIGLGQTQLISPRPYHWKWYLSIQKPRHVSDEQRRILVLRPVIGIGIEDELRVGQVALKNERIRGIDDHVMAAVDHQRGVDNLPEVVKRPPARNT